MSSPPTPLTLASLIARAQPPQPWSEGDNIPWDSPDFSQRMLTEHLSQAHDLASRRSHLIDEHVAFIHDRLHGRPRARVLELACGPGLYLHRLARLGHSCRGIDFSPASIAYARNVAENERLDCSFEQADLRKADFGSGYDLVLLVYGQFNVFERERAKGILQRAHAALSDGGLLILEPQELNATRGAKEFSSDWSALDHGLFSAAPHLLLHEHFWDESSRTATDRWHVVDAATAAVRRHASSTCYYTPDELDAVLGSVGFGQIARYPSLSGTAQPTMEGLYALVAAR